MLTNDEVLAVNQRSTQNKPLFDRDGLIAWTAVDPASGDSYLALFNARDRVRLAPDNARHVSGVVTQDPASSSEIDIDVRDGRKLFLVVQPLTNGDSFTAVCWRAPRLIMADGSERSLTELTWTQADAQWDSTKVKKAAPGQLPELSAQATATVEYALPAGAQRFKATALVDAKDTSKGQVRFLTVVGTAATKTKVSASPSKWT